MTIIYFIIINNFLFIIQNHCTIVINFKLISFKSVKQKREHGKGADIKVTISFCVCIFQSLVGLVIYSQHY